MRGRQEPRGRRLSRDERAVVPGVGLFCAAAAGSVSLEPRVFSSRARLRAPSTPPRIPASKSCAPKLGEHRLILMLPVRASEARLPARPTLTKSAAASAPEEDDAVVARALAHSIAVQQHRRLLRLDPRRIDDTTAISALVSRSRAEIVNPPAHGRWRRLFAGRRPNYHRDPRIGPQRNRVCLLRPMDREQRPGAAVFVASYYTCDGQFLHSPPALYPSRLRCQCTPGTGPRKTASVLDCSPPR